MYSNFPTSSNSSFSQQPPEISQPDVRQQSHSQQAPQIVINMGTGSSFRNFSLSAQPSYMPTSSPTTDDDTGLREIWEKLSRENSLQSKTVHTHISNVSSQPEFPTSEKTDQFVAQHLQQYPCQYFQRENQLPPETPASPQIYGAHQIPFQQPMFYPQAMPKPLQTTAQPPSSSEQESQSSPIAQVVNQLFSHCNGLERQLTQVSFNNQKLEKQVGTLQQDLLEQKIENDLLKQRVHKLEEAKNESDTKVDELVTRLIELEGSAKQVENKFKKIRQSTDQVRAKVFSTTTEQVYTKGKFSYRPKTGTETIRKIDELHFTDVKDDTPLLSNIYVFFTTTRKKFIIPKGQGMTHEEDPTVYFGKVYYFKKQRSWRLIHHGKNGYRNKVVDITFDGTTLFKMVRVNSTELKKYLNKE